MIITKKEFAELNNRIDESISSIAEAVRSSEDRIVSLLVSLTDVVNNNTEQIMNVNNRIEQIENNLAELLSTVKQHGEISVQTLESIQGLHSLTVETKNTIQSSYKALSGTNSQVCEAVNMLMIQHLLDKAEKMDSDNGSTSSLQISAAYAAEKQKQSIVRIRCLRCGSKLDGNRYCMLCGFDNVEPEIFDFSN